MKASIFLSYLFFAALAPIACSPKGPHRIVNTAPQTPSQQITYERVRPIFAQYCSACHPSRSQPNWLIYEQAKPLAKSGRLLQRVFTERSMPPPGSAQAARITESDRQQIANWVLAGAPLNSASVEAPVLPQNPNAPNENSSLVGRCLQCHGPIGPSLVNQPKIPVLAGQSQKYLIQQIRNFKWRRRVDPGGVMNDEAADLSEREIDEVARYFSEKSGLPNKAPLPKIETATIGRGHTLAAQYCMSCHMNPLDSFKANSPLVPVLAGQSTQYLINQLLYFRNRERVSPVMNEFAKNLDNDQIRDLAEFFNASCKR